MLEKSERELLPNRRSIRLQGYDYSSGGGYFVTIRCKDGAHRFGRIVPVTETTMTVRALLVCARDTADVDGYTGADKQRPYSVGGDEPHPYSEWRVELNEFGHIVEEELRNIETRFPGVTIEGYVVMPNHVHFVLLNDGELGHQLSLIVRGLKSIVSNRCMRICKERGVWMEPLWLRNYYEHIIRNREDLEQTLRYMYQNPTRWGAEH